MGDKKRKRLAEAEAASALALMSGRPDGDETDRIETTTAAEPAPTHPEEMKASVTLHLGDKVRFTATARATPAGIIAGALALTAITVPLIWISRRR